MIVDELDYEQIVALHSEDLYRFAYSLAGKPDEASELTQETYCRLLTKGTQLRDRAKVKQWLFTTLYRVYLGWKRHENRFPHLEIESVASELPTLTPSMVDEADSAFVMDALLDIDERYRAPLVLYLPRNRRPAGGAHRYRHVAPVARQRRAAPTARPPFWLDQ